MNMKRVFHPTNNAWQDVPEGDVDAWSKAGWHKTKGKHIDDSEALPVGESYVSPPVVVESATETRTATAAAASPRSASE